MNDDVRPNIKYWYGFKIKLLNENWMKFERQALDMKHLLQFTRQFRISIQNKFPDWVEMLFKFVGGAKMLALWAYKSSTNCMPVVRKIFMSP